MKLPTNFRLRLSQSVSLRDFPCWSSKLPALLSFLALILINGVTAGSGLPQKADSQAKEDGPIDLVPVLAVMDELVGKGKTPAAFAAVGGRDLAPQILCRGKRKAGEDAAVAPDDLVHIGSCTKAMTAVLIARLVEQGKLDWDDTVAQRLPEIAEKLAACYRDVTLVQLLSHTSGLPANPLNWRLNSELPIQKVRNNLLLRNLKRDHGHEAGKHLYSNFGYMLAGHIAEKTCGADWEELMRREVFEPLDMRSAGFGPPGDPKGSDQPWGHLLEKTARPDQPRLFKSIHSDNAAALGPAGTVHLSLADWLKFAGLFCGTMPEGFLTDASLQLLQSPIADDYALGWSVVERSWGHGKVLSHNGSNTMWVAVCWLAPRTGRIYLAAVNHGAPDAAVQTDAIVGKLIEQERNAQSR